MRKFFPEQKSKSVLGDEKLREADFKNT